MFTSRSLLHQESSPATGVRDRKTVMRAGRSVPLPTASFTTSSCNSIIYYCHHHHHHFQQLQLPSGKCPHKFKRKRYLSHFISLPPFSFHFILYASLPPLKALPKLTASAKFGLSWRIFYFS